MAPLNWATYLERAVGKGHPTLSDTVNRALRQLLSESGYNPDASPFPGLMGPVFNVKAFGELNDGTAVTGAASLAAINAAKAVGGGIVYWPYGTYNFGNRAAFSRVFDLGVTTNITFLADHATFLVNTTDDTQPLFFYIQNPENIEFRGFRFRDTGTNLGVDWHGADCIQLYGAGAAGFHGGNRIVDCQADSVVAFLILGNTTNTDSRVRDVRVDNCIVRNSYYGVVCQENGDGLRGNWRCENVRRAYFPYGVTDHDVEVSIYHDGVAYGANSACLIKRYERDTRDITLKVHFYGSVAQYLSGVTMEHQPVVTGTGVIDDVAIDVHIDETIVNNNAMVPIRFRSYTSAGVEETVTTTNRWDKVRLSGGVGTLTGGISAIVVGCKQATEGKIYLDPSFYRGQTAAQPHFPGFVARVAHDREFRTAIGDLTSQTVTIPLAGFDANALTIRVLVYAQDDKTSLLVQNTTLQEDIIIGYNAFSGGTAIQSVTNLFKAVQGTAATITYSASGENFLVSFAGAPYNNANALARVEVQFVSRGPLY